MKSCLFSNRIYKDTLSFKDNMAICNTIYSFSEAVIKAYSMVVNNELYNKEFDQSLHMEIKNMYGYNDYYANSILREAKAIFKSNKEVQKYQIKEMENSIKNRKDKIKATEKSISNKEKMLTSVVAIHNATINNKKQPKFRSYKGAKEKLVDKDNLIFEVKFYKEVKTFNIYEFEVLYLKPEIKRLKNRLKQLRYGLNRFEEKLSKLKKKPRLACFGGKDLFKAQFTKDDYINNHNLWRMEFITKRHCRFQVSGRADADGGNFVFKYSGDNLTFKAIDGTMVTLSKVIFPYNQDAINYAVSLKGTDRKAIAWEIEDKGEYYIIKAVVELPKKDINYSKADGVIGLDINVDHFALTNISADGNLLGHKIIYFDILGKSSNQSTNILGNAIKELFKYCLKYNKPLAMEDLDTEKSKSRLKYGNKKINAKLSQFAYKKITDMIYSRAYKDAIAVFKTNPALTSQIGKIKYMKSKGLSSHVSASYVIGRRVLGFKEKVKGGYRNFLTEKIVSKHHWSHWRHLSKTLKSVYPKHFYKTIDFNTITNISDLKEYLIAN